jgi:hypothetical protein
MTLVVARVAWIMRTGASASAGDAGTSPWQYKLWRIQYLRSLQVAPSSQSRRPLMFSQLSRSSSCRLERARQPMASSSRRAQSRRRLRRLGFGGSSGRSRSFVRATSLNQSPGDNKRYEKRVSLSAAAKRK